MDYRKELSVLERKLRSSLPRLLFDEIETQIIVIEDSVMSDSDNKQSGFEICPKCKSGDIYSINGLKGSGGNYAIDKHKCSVCDSVWENVYVKEDDGHYDDIYFEYLTKDKSMVKSNKMNIFYYEFFRYED